MEALDLEQEYSKYLRGVRLSSAKIASLLVITLVPFGALLDWFVYPDLFAEFLWLRLGCSLGTALAWLGLRNQWGEKFYPVLVQAWYIFPSLMIALMIALSEGAASPYYAGLNLVILAVCAVMQTSMRESLFALGIIFLLYLCACVEQGEFGNVSLIFNNFYFMITTALIVLAGNYNYNRLRRQEFVLRHQLAESQTQLEARNLQLSALDEAKSRFFANISHELRTPLTLIAGPIEKLRQAPEILREPALAQLVQIMEANSLRLLKLINNLLDMIRLEGGQAAATRTTLNLDETLQGLARSIEHLAQEKGVRLEKIPGSTPAVVILDQDKLEKIVLNLLLNAVKFTARGGTVSLQWQVTGPDLHLVVADTGIGLSAEELPHIFDRFWQANTSSTRKFQGVGIGLALVKELTEAMGGQVSVESETGKGTRFLVKVPAPAGDATVLTPASEVGQSAAASAETEEWLSSLYRRADLFIEPGVVTGPVPQASSLIRRRKPLVIVAEDQPDMAEFVASQLRDTFEVLIASDGQYAIDLTRQYNPDLLVLDMMLPEKDGLDVCRELSDVVQARGLPILVLTARADETTKLTILQNGATDFMTKPFSSIELKVRVQNLVSLSRLSHQLADRNRDLSETMEQLKDSEVRMVQQAKMVSLGRMSAGLIHEINNPLNYVNGAVQLLRKQLASSPILVKMEDTFHDIEDGLKRVSDLVSSLRTFSHPQGVRFDQVNLRELVLQACRLTAGATETSKPVIDMDPELSVYGNPIQLLQIFINLIQNAHDACAGRPEPKIVVQARAQGENVEIKVTDNGPGITPDVLEKIFDPFFTTKEVGQGMGLGLSICHTVVQAHQGDLTVESIPGEKTEFTIRLPAQSVKLLDEPTEKKERYESIV
jgi:signal transduction histidine kinase